MENPQLPLQPQIPAQPPSVHPVMTDHQPLPVVPQPVVSPTPTIPQSPTPVHVTTTPPQVQPPIMVSSQPQDTVLQKRLLVIPIALTALICAVVFGAAGYYFGKQNTQIISDIPETLPVQTEALATPTEALPTVEPTPASSAYTFQTFSLTHPTSWQAFDSKTNPDFFTQNNLTGFDNFAAIQKDGYYLIFGFDTPTKDAEVGGIFVSDTDYQEYLKNHDEIKIGDQQYFLSKSDIALSTLTDPNRSAGIYGSASLAEYTANKTANQKGGQFDGYTDYVSKKGNSYMVFKFSQSGNTITPEPVQSEIKQILQSIQW